MRFLLGIIVGCLLTVGGAYVHDAAQPETSAATDATVVAATDGRMVNWSVVNHNVHGVNDWVQTQWAWISSRFNRAG